MPSRPTRRAFLRGMGLGGALLPLLSSELARAACLPQGPKRLVILDWPNGVTAWPAPADRAADIALPAFMKDLEPYKGACLFIRGLRFKAVQESPNPKVPPDGHQSHAGILTGKRAYRLVDKFSVADGISIDQYVANALVKNGFAGIPSLALGVINNYASTQWRGSQQPVEPDKDPYHVFDTIFGGPTGMGPSMDIERQRKLRRSILDQVGRDLERFARSLGSDDRARVGAHLESIREIERQLTPGPRPPAQCPAPTLGARIDVKDPVNFPAIWQLQMDITVAAMAADITRVAVIQVGNDSNHNIPASWLGYPDFHHGIAHSGSLPKKARLDQWYHEMYASLVGRLDREREGAKTMLDSCAVVAANNMEHGLHAINRVPWIIAGSCGGAFAVGRSIDLGSVPHNGLLIALANAMGVPTETFGDPEYGGETPGLRVGA